MNKVQMISNENMRSDIPDFQIGDNLQIDMRIVEGGKERIQAFTGTVIARNGAGRAQTVTLRRVSYGQGLERVIPIHSPRVVGMKVTRSGSVRRAKLYYLRDMVGKAARVKELRTSQK